MKTVLQKLQTLLDAGTGTYLAAATVVIGDQRATQTSSTAALVRVYPIDGEDKGEHIGTSGWYDLFNVTVMATYPPAWADSNKQLDLCEEIKQIVRDNWQWTSGGEQVVLKRRSWSYGYRPDGQRIENTITVTVQYEAPQPGETA